MAAGAPIRSPCLRERPESGAKPFLDLASSQRAQTFPSALKTGNFTNAQFFIGHT